MYVTVHAEKRFRSRLGYEPEFLSPDQPNEADYLVNTLEAMPGEMGKVVYYWQLDGTRQALDGSNGNLLVAIAVDGSVDTVYLRRTTQTLDPSHFNARKVVRLP